jgi:energy-converting hydrogenase Eha subunit G
VFSLGVTPQVIPARIGAAVERSSYSLSLVTTVISTVIIVTRILMVSRIPRASHQTRIAMEIIIESATLYSISALVYTSMLSGITAHTPASATYQIYADIFFAYMAVESHPSSLSVLIF